MSQRARLRTEGMLFFLAACVVMVIAANHRALLADVGLLERDPGLRAGDGWRALVVGTVVALAAYGGLLVVLFPFYEFLAYVFSRPVSGTGADGREPDRAGERGEAGSKKKGGAGKRRKARR